MDLVEFCAWPVDGRGKQGFIILNSEVGGQGETGAEKKGAGEPGQEIPARSIGVRAH